MNTRLYVSMALICIALLAVLFDSIPMLTAGPLTERIEPEGGGYYLMRYDHFVRASGYAGITFAAMGLLILFIPFRKRELWAWFALAILVFMYIFPTSAIRLLVPFPGWHIFYQGIFEPGLPRNALLTLLFDALMLLGLALSAPHFFRKRAG